MDGLSGLFVPKQQRGAPLRVGEKILSSPELESVSVEVQKAIHLLKAASEGSKVILVVDQLDLLLAAGGNGVGIVGLGEMLMGWREVCDVSTVAFCVTSNQLFRMFTPQSFHSQRICLWWQLSKRLWKSNMLHF